MRSTGPHQPSSIWCPQQLLVLYESVRFHPSRFRSGKQRVIFGIFISECLVFTRVLCLWKWILSDTSLWPKVDLSYREISVDPIPERFVFKLAHSSVLQRTFSNTVLLGKIRKPPGPALSPEGCGVAWGGLFLLDEGIWEGWTGEKVPAGESRKMSHDFHRGSFSFFLPFSIPLIIPKPNSSPTYKKYKPLSSKPNHNSARKEPNAGVGNAVATWRTPVWHV